MTCAVLALPLRPREQLARRDIQHLREPIHECEFDPLAPSVLQVQDRCLARLCFSGKLPLTEVLRLLEALLNALKTGVFATQT